MLLLLSLLACKHKDEIPAICDQTASAWSDGTTAFTETSAEWGIADLHPAGTRISAVDLDRDGYPDLVIRDTVGADDFASGVRHTWYLHNTGTGRFEDRTEASGLTTARGTGERPGSTYAFGDVDNDGDLDAYSGWPDSAGAWTETSEILLNDGSGNFTLASDDNDVRRGPGDMPYGAAFVDTDLDGNLDLWVSEYDNAGGPQQSRLYRGRGDGTFADVTDDRGLITKSWNSASVAELNVALAHSRSWSALACDLNDDGYAELLAASYGRAPNLLWQNDGTGHYENKSVTSGYAYDDRIDWSDNESARCWCHLHPDDADCAGVPAPQYIACNVDADAFRWDHDSDRNAYRLGGNSGSTICGDVDNDGHMDLLTTEIVHWDVGSSSDPSEILRNTGSSDVAFERPGNDVTGLVREHDGVSWDDGDMTGSLFDFDNDGWLDVYIGVSDYPGTHGLLYHQDAAMQFTPVPIDEGIDQHRSHGSAVADFDRDGDLDIVVGTSSARCDDDCYDVFDVRLFENQMNGNFLQLELVGNPALGANGSAIGARIEVTANGVTQTHQVDGGHGQLGLQDDLIQHFGLGTSCEDATVRVVWPAEGFPEQTYTLQVGHRWRLAQGEAAALADVVVAE